MIKRHTQLWNSVAVLPAAGIGDALLMMIASHQLRSHGCRVTTFHNALPELSTWFPGHDLKKLPENLIAALESYDLILVENDNSPKIKQLIANYRWRLSIFYPTYRADKHGPLAPLDHVFNPRLPMAINIASAISTLLSAEQSQNNGLTPLASLVKRRHLKRVLIHPSSSSTQKNWKAKGFLAVANRLRAQGFTPLFCVGPQEKDAWKWIEKTGHILADAPTLSDLAALVFESGFVIGNDSLIGHLASNLEIPNLVIADEEKRMRLWRPGWLQGELVLPWLHLRKIPWQHFISAGKVMRAFAKLSSSSLCEDPADDDTDND